MRRLARKHEERQPRAIPGVVPELVDGFIAAGGIDLGETPQRAHNRCYYLALAFAFFVKGSGFEAHVIRVVGTRVPYTTMFEFGFNVGHYLTWIPAAERAVDWTSRQFWIDTPCPFIMNTATLKAYWKKIEWPPNSTKP